MKKRLLSLVIAAVMMCGVLAATSLVAHAQEAHVPCCEESTISPFDDLKDLITRPKG